MFYLAVTIFLIANLPIFILIGWAIFGSWGGFLDQIFLGSTPDWISAFKGQYHEDKAAEFSLLWWLLGCGAVILLEIGLLYKFFGFTFFLF
ncbi:MAG: hypothetical protein ACIAQZ_03975 [Sedimentisphaeraceae bacterium JB056]